MIGKYKAIALCTSRIGDDVSYQYISALGERLAEMGFRLFVYHCCSDLYWNTPEEKGEERVFDLIDFDRIDVLVMFEEKLRDTELVDKLIDSAFEKGIPVISISGSNKKTIHIDFDSKAGFEKVVEHVLSVHKPKSVHFIAGNEGLSFSEERIEVFKKQMEKNSMPFDKESMVSYGDFWSGPTTRAVEKLFAENRIPEAIICANDIMAITACNVVTAHGLRVPEDVLITGYDGIDEINFSVPKITSCLCSYQDLAYKTAEVAGKCLDGEPVERSYTLIPTLLLSESCGCPACKEIKVTEYLSSLNNRFFRYREEGRALDEMNSAIYSCRTFEEAANVIPTNIIYDCCCLLRRECTDNTIDPLSHPDLNEQVKSMYLFFDTDDMSAPHTDSFPVSDIIPHLDEALDRGYPLIFTALNFIDIPLGYVCFHYRNYGIDNYCKIVQNVNSLNNGIGSFRIMRHQQYMTKQFERIAVIDHLTGLYNRNGSQTAFVKMKSELARDGGTLTFILADLDGLKYINDNFGHTEGDNAITAIANAIKHACPENAICARIGGDEIIAFFDEPCSEQEIRERMKCYIDSLAEKPYEISASLGLCTASGSEIPDFEQLIKASDKLMYNEKRKRKHFRQRYNDE